MSGRLIKNIAYFIVVKNIKERMLRLRFKNTEVFNFSGAFRGMRNPKESHHLSDSVFGIARDEKDILTKIPDGSSFAKLTCDGECFSFACIGKRDMDLAQKLIKSGPEHRKFLRQIFVSVDITAPLYWWKEFDTYHVGTVANSTSTMHKISSREISADCFETDDYAGELPLIDPVSLSVRSSCFIEDLEQLRQMHLIYKDLSNDETYSEHEKSRCRQLSKKYWKELIRWLPSSWLQTRTVTLNYENLLAMCSKGQRRFHKLNEWSGVDKPDAQNFIAWARALPYAQELIFIDEEAKGGAERG